MGHLKPTREILSFKRWWVQWFWDENFKYNEKTGCLEWIKGLSPTGYGRTSMNGVQYFAHRIAYAIYYQTDPGDKLVMHSCDNPRCCHPFHLSLGTHDDNSKGMVRRERNQKGDRHWTKRMPERFQEVRHIFVEAARRNAQRINGANHPTTVLTEDIVRQIKERSANGEGNRELAAEFGVTHSNISAIVLGKSWAHVQYAQYEKGEDRYNAKLNPDAVRDIRERAKNGQTNMSIARHYRVSSVVVANILKGTAWKHIE